MGPDLPRALFEGLMRDYLRPAAIGRTLTRVLTTTSNQEARSDALVPIFLANPLYEHGLLGLNMLGDRVKRWSSEEEQNPDRQRLLVERSISLLGRAASRNVAACIRINRATSIGLARKKGQVHVIDPHAQLRFALHAETFCQDNKMPFPDQAFLAGLHYDLLSALLAARRAPADARTAVDAVWREGFLMGRIALAIGGLLKNFKFGKVTLAAGTVLPIGKILMSVNFPKGSGSDSWSGFVAELEKQYPKTSDRWIAEELKAKKTFAMTYPELSALFVSFMGAFTPIEKAVRYHREPWMLTKGDPSLLLLTHVLAASASLAQQLPPGKRLEALPPIPRTMRRFFTENGIHDEALLATLKAVVSPGSRQG